MNNQKTETDSTETVELHSTAPNFPWLKGLCWAIAFAIVWFGVWFMVSFG